MKKGTVYTIIYTFALSGACAALLNIAREIWKTRISDNENYDKIQAVVETLGLASADAPRAEVMKVYAASVKPTKVGPLDVFEAKRGDTLVGYALEANGRGNYGPIKGILAIDPQAQTILGLKIYEQNETPGLGARITSPEWLRQFAGKPMITAGVPGIEISSRKKGPNVVEAVTGASRTMYSLSLIINTLLNRYLSGGMALEELEIGVDAVTKATPGYPKNFVSPKNLREEVRREPLMVEPGITNLAFGKTVTSSMGDIPPTIGDLPQLVDGIKTCGEFDFVELDKEPQWVQVDLGAVCKVSAIVVWHYYKNPIVYKDVIVQVSDDPEFKNNVRTVFNNDDDNSSKLGAGSDTTYWARWWGEIVDLRGPEKNGTPARCVRVWTNGGVSGEETRFIELAVFGKQK